MSNTSNNPYYSDLTGQLQCTFIRSVDSGTSGDCTLITGEVNGLIDLGADPTLSKVKEKIWSKGTKTLVDGVEQVKLDFVVLTHFHKDHVTSDIQSAIANLDDKDYGINMDDCIFYLPHAGLELGYTETESSWEPINKAFRFYPSNENKQEPNLPVLKGIEDACLTALHNVYPSSYSNHVKRPQAFNGHPEGKDWREEAIEEVFNDHLKLSFLNVNPDNYPDYYEYTGSNQNWANHGTDYNAFSMLTILEHYNHKFVFTGDMVKPAQEKYANWVTDCDVYKVEHHGLEYNTSDKWLNALNPKYAVICKYSSYYLPDSYQTTYPRDDEFTNRKTVQQLASKGCMILSTHDKDFIDINSTYEKLWVDTDVIPDYHVGPGYLNATYPYYVAAMKKVSAYQERVNDEQILGGCTRYGNIVIMQMRLLINKALAGGSWYQILNNLPKPKQPQSGSNAPTFHAPLTVIKHGNNSKSYSGWINQYGNLCIGIFNSASSLAVGDSIFISGVYITDEKDE